MRIQKVVKEFLALESIPLTFLKEGPISIAGDKSKGVIASRRGCPRQFRISGVCFSDSKYYFEEAEIRIKVDYEFGDYADSFMLKGKLIGDGVDMNVDIAPKRDINYKEGKCTYTLMGLADSPFIGISLMLEVLY